MSRTTANKLLVAPSAATALTVASSATAWLAGAWVEFIASTPTAIAIAGVCSSNITGLPGLDVEVDIGIGAAASEVVIGTLRMWTGSQSIRSGHANLFAVPIDSVPIGSRVAIRIRSGFSGTATTTIALLYYASLTSGHLATVLTKTVPAAAAGVSVTPSGGLWTDSAYVQLTAGLGNDIAILGICAARASTPSDMDREYDLATGGAGSEVVITTLRAAFGNITYGQPVTLWLPAPYPITASTRIAVRSRQSSTNVTIHQVSLLYLDNPVLAGAGAVETSTPFLWIS